MAVSVVRRIDVVHGLGRIVGQVLAEADDLLGGREVAVWTSDDELVDGLAEAEVILGVRFPACDWSAAGRLRLIQLAGSGVDGLLPARGLARSVRVANARGVSAPAMAEFALAQVLALAKRFPESWHHQVRRVWQQTVPKRLAGGRAVVIGAGPVGRCVAEYLRVLGMTVTGVRRTGRSCDAFDDTVGVDGLDAALTDADVVIVAVASTPETRHLVDGVRLRRCPPGVLLVNIARGDVVDQAAVAELLRTGHLGGAALDVFDVEPLPASDPLWESPRTLLTPHVSWYSADYRRSVAQLLVANVERIEQGGEPINPVDIGRGY